MTHLDEFTLNEYVDDELPAARRAEVDTHLAECASCQAEVAELQQLFFALDTTAEAAFAVDMSAAVAQQIEQEKTVGSEQFSVNSGLLLLFEIAATAVLLFFLWPTVQKWLMLARGWQNQFAIDFAVPKLVSWAEITAVSSSSIQAISQQLQSTTFSELATLQWGMLIGIALIIWLAGNRLLFTNDSR